MCSKHPSEKVFPSSFELKYPPFLYIMKFMVDAGCLFSERRVKQSDLFYCGEPLSKKMRFKAARHATQWLVSMEVLCSVKQVHMLWGQMLKESRVRTEEVDGLSHFCLSFVLCRWEDAGCLRGHFRRMIYGANASSDSIRELYIPLQMCRVISQQPTGEPHLLPTCRQDEKQSNLWSITQSHMPEFIYQT